MALLLQLLQQRSQKPWLTGLDQGMVLALAQTLYRQLMTQFPEPSSHRLLLMSSEPEVFLAAFVAAITGGYDLFLASPHWTEQEKHTVLSLVQPTLQLHDRTWQPLPSFLPHPLPPSPIARIMIPTGGSSGQIRFAVHTWETLLASVQGFQEYFQIDRVNSFCVLPLYHVSGLMQFVRSFISEGQLVIQSFKTLLTEQAPAPQDCFLSLVPTQLHRLLMADRAWVSWLINFHAILLGGAPAWEDLLNRARDDRLPLAPTYGMTETASQIATLKPADFLAGNRSCGQVLPHAQVTIRDAEGNLLPPNQPGILQVQGTSLCLGYYSHPLPLPFHQRCFQTDDVGYLDAAGYLHLLGRNNRKIITGGENVFPDEVEGVLRATGLVQDVCVIGVPDGDWGERVTAVYVPKTQTVTNQQLKMAIGDRLSRYKQPKQWIATDSLPRNAQGKINQTALKASLPQLLNTAAVSAQPEDLPVLALVIGNSRLHWAWLDQDRVQATWHTPHLDQTAINQLIATHFDFSTFVPTRSLPWGSPPSPILLIASVVPEETQLWQAYLQARVLTLADIPLQGFYPTLGVDRALALFGAAETLGCPVLVIDGGTALTLTGLDDQRWLVGGAILPGVGLQVRSLIQGTAALPSVELMGGKVLDRWAKSTPDAIRSGILYTLLAGLREFITDWLRQFPTSAIVLTGGDGELLSQLFPAYCPEIAGNLHYDPLLIFRGIRSIGTRLRD